MQPLPQLLCCPRKEKKMSTTGQICHSLLTLSGQTTPPTLKLANMNTMSDSMAAYGLTGLNWTVH